jgi:hypothetical protein
MLQSKPEALITSLDKQAKEEGKQVERKPEALEKDKLDKSSSSTISSSSTLGLQNQIEQLREKARSIEDALKKKESAKAAIMQKAQVLLQKKQESKIATSADQEVQETKNTIINKSEQKEGDQATLEEGKQVERKPEALEKDKLDKSSSSTISSSSTLGLQNQIEQLREKAGSIADALKKKESAKAAIMQKAQVLLQKKQESKIATSADQEVQEKLVLAEGKGQELIETAKAAAEKAAEDQEKQEEAKTKARDEETATLAKRETLAPETDIIKMSRLTFNSMSQYQEAIYKKEIIVKEILLKLKYLEEKTNKLQQERQKPLVDEQVIQKGLSKSATLAIEVALQAENVKIFKEIDAEFSAFDCIDIDHLCNKATNAKYTAARAEHVLKYKNFQEASVFLNALTEDTEYVIIYKNSQAEEDIKTALVTSSSEAQAAESWYTEATENQQLVLGENKLADTGLH